MSRSSIVCLVLGLSACVDRQARLDDALREYVAQRDAEAQAACECYDLFLDPSQLGGQTFESKEECLEVLGAPSTDAAVECLKSVLEAANVPLEEGTEIVSCYTNSVAEQTQCYEENAVECSSTACSSGVAETDMCRGTLSSVEAQQLSACALNF